MKRLTGSSPRLFKLCTQFVVTIGIALACASTLSAQDRLFGLLPKDLFATQGQDHLIEIDTRPEFLGQIRRAIPLSTRFHRGILLGDALHSIGRGRYLVWLSDDSRVVNLFDTVTSQVSLFPVLPNGSRIVAVDSSRMRVFVDARTETVILDGQLGTVRSVPRASESFILPYRAHASSTDRLFIGWRAESSTQAVVDVVDVAAGRVERTFTLATDRILGMAVDSDGRRLFVAAPEGLQVYDAQNGALLAQFPGFVGLALNAKSALQIDESRRRLLLKMGAPPGPPVSATEAHVAFFNLDTLALLGIASGRDPVWDPDVQLLTGPRSPMYLFNRFFPPEDTCHARLEVFAPDSGALRQRVELSKLWGAASSWSVCSTHLALQSPPPAPMIQSQTVSGRRVTVSWAPTYDALHYDIEAGSAPGLNGLAVSRGHTSTSFTVDGIPSGRYFVRIRAINWVGRSLPSNEVEVVVP